MRLSMALALVLATVAGACSVANPNHCSNQQGHTTCKATNSATPYCSKCTADNNGCVAEVSDGCDAGSTSEPASTSNPTTTSDPLPTTSTASTSTASTSTTSTPTSTTDASTTTTGTTDPSTSTTSESTSTGTTTDTSTTTTTATTTTTSTGTTADTSTATTDTDTDNTTGSMCGNNVKEFGETCDGNDIGSFSLCSDKSPAVYSGGNLTCLPSCKGYDETDCCLASGQACLLNGHACCKPGLCVTNCG